MLRRIARHGMGWLPPGKPISKLEQKRTQLATFADEEGRDLSDIQIAPRMQNYDPDDPDTWIDRIRAWNDFGATHLAVDTMDMGFDSPEEHIDQITDIAEIWAQLDP
jgi:alkanesulfonate monooxygenase SsuD/methylene tetrahydromethanopterin reductase-like flavin-dependent oxidoreductase (luciferase family)